MGTQPSLRLFFFLFEVIYKKNGRSWVSLQASQAFEYKIFEPYTDSYERGNLSFKDEFYRIIVAPGVQPFWKDSASGSYNFPLYQSWALYDVRASTYSVSRDRLTKDDEVVLAVLVESVKEKRSTLQCRHLVDGPFTKKFWGIFCTSYSLCLLYLE